jgi:hypothetical protein
VITCHEAAKLLLAALDRKREISPGVHVGVEIKVHHSRRCKPGFCKCGGFQQGNEVRDALNVLREVLG